MTRSWAALLGDEEPAAAESEDEERRRRFRRLRSGLSKSRRAIVGRPDGLALRPVRPRHVGAPRGGAAVGRHRRRDDAGGDRAARGEAAEDERGRARRPRGGAGGAGDARGRSRSCTWRHGRPSCSSSASTATGKTTTIGKLAARLAERGRSVIVAAADTYRAAADEQLEIWAERAGADFVGSTRGGDPAAVAFDSIAAAQARGRDVVIVDTAGRLHTQTNLMEELAKVRRVIAQRLDGAPHETLLVVDATHRPERPASGAALPRGGRRHRRRPDEARRHREGRHRRRDRPRARPAGQARRRGRSRSTTCSRSTPPTSRAPWWRATATDRGQVPDVAGRAAAAHRQSVGSALPREAVP